MNIIDEYRKPGGGALTADQVLAVSAGISEGLRKAAGMVRMERTGDDSADMILERAAHNIELAAR